MKPLIIRELVEQLLKLDQDMVVRTDDDQLSGIECVEVIPPSRFVTEQMGGDSKPWAILLLIEDEDE